MLEEFYYLFITDPVELPHEQKYQDYRAREPGYEQSWFSAYNYAFQVPKDRGITPELLVGIRQQAMSFQKESLPGGYRNQTVFFQIKPARFADRPGERVVSFNSTLAGIYEFVDHWFLKRPLSVHHISFMQNQKKIAWMVSGKQDNKIKWTYQEFAGQSHDEWLDLEEHKKKIEEFFGDSRFSCYIQCMPEVKMEQMPTEIERNIRGIIKEFEEEIPTAKSEDEIITVITKHIQHIAQLHPFLDGNIRTCYILLNKLLRDYDLSLSILLNPNRFDCCSLDEVVDMIKQGQNYYQQLLRHQDGEFVFDTKNENGEYERFRVKPEPLIDVDRSTMDDFSTIVIKDKRSHISSVEGRRDSLFALKLKSSELLMEQPKDPRLPAI